MAVNIILNENNITNDKGYNKLVYNFPVVQKFDGMNDTIMVSNFNLYFSWFNISKANNNTKFSYKWWNVDGQLTDIFVVELQEGMYSLEQIYEVFQKSMVINGHHLIVNDPSSSLNGSYVYFVELRSNATFYSIEFLLSSVSTAYDLSGQGNYLNTFIKPTATGKSPWNLPTNWETMEVMMPSNGNFGDLLGFPQGYSIQKDLSSLNPITQEQFVFPSIKAPMMQPSNSVIMTCNLIDHGSMANPSNILHSFVKSNDVSYGDIIETKSSNNTESLISKGQYSKIEVTLFDQRMEKLMLNDPQMLLVLSIKRNEKKEEV